MAFSLPTNLNTIEAYVGALYGYAVGSTTMSQINADITSYGGLNNTLNSYYTAAFGSQTTASVAKTIVANVGLGTDANAIAYVTGQLNAAAPGARGAAVAAILNAFSGLTADATYGGAATAWNTSVANSVSYAQSNSADATLATAKAAAATAAAAAAAAAAAPVVVALTTSVNTYTAATGTNTSFTADGTTFSALDSITGANAGDSLTIADTSTAANAGYALPAGTTVTSIPTVSITSSGSLGNAGTPTVLDLSTNFTGTTQFNLVSSGSGGGDVTVGNTSTNSPSVTIANAAGALVLVGGSSIKASNSGTTTSITGAKLTTVSVNGSNGTAGSTVTIDNTSSSGTSATGTSLTSVTLTNVDSNSALKGASLTTLNIGGADSSARTNTITNATVGHTLTINSTGTGYAVNTTTENQTVVTDAAAKSVIINATNAKSSIDVHNNTAMTSLTLTGNQSLKLSTGVASLVSIDGSAYTGNITFGTLNAATTNVKSGSGNDTVTLAATVPVTVSTGAGDDVVTLTSAIASGSSINLGDGNDQLLYASTGSVATSTTTVIDGGTGTNTISSLLLNGANSTQFVNFQNLGLDQGSGTYDTTLLSGITGVALDGTAGAATYTLTKAIGLHVLADSTTASNVFSFSGASGLADAYTISFEAKGASSATASSPTDINAGTVSVNGIENLTINAGGSGYTNDKITIADTSLRTLTITGASTKTAVAFAQDAASVNVGNISSPSDSNGGVSLIDASAYTGKLTVTLTNVTANSGGLTVLGGSGNDTFVSQSALSTTFTGGAGSDTFDVSATLINSATSQKKVTITDFSSGDSIIFKHQGTEVFYSAKASIGSATSLDTAIGNVIGTDSTAANGATNAKIDWFQYGGNTYIVEVLTDDHGGVSAPATTDLVVKLNGLVDLSNASLTGTGATGVILTA